MAYRCNDTAFVSVANGREAIVIAAPLPDSLVDSLVDAKFGDSIRAFAC